MRVTSLRWWTVLLPTVAIILVDYARHKLIAGFTHPWQDEAVLLLGVLLVALATSQLWFQRIEHSQRREREAEMLRRIGMEVTSNLNLEAVLNSILLRGREALDADCLGIAMAGAARRELILQTREAAAPRRLPALPEAGFPWETATAGEEREQIVALPAVTVGGCPSCHRCLALPLRMGSQLLGSLCVGSRDAGPYNPRQRGVIDQMVHLAAVAIANSLLHERAQNLATLEERDRIAREIHDSLAQALGYLSMKAQGTREMLKRGEPERVEAALEEMGQAADDAYVDVREAILGLRLSARAEGGFRAMLEEYLEKYSRQSGVATRMVTQGEDGFDLPPRTEIQLVRVIQEALTNVRKHARAAHAWVTLDWQDGVARVTIGDDGQGFDPTLAEGQSGPHYGIATMRERMTAIGGQLEVESRPGSGTVIAATVSRATGKGESNGHG